MTLEADFHHALHRLCTWYADSVKAQSFDGPSISHSKPGAVDLRIQSYPDVQEWDHRWRQTRSDDERRVVIEEMTQEYEELSKAKKRAESASQELVEARYWLLDSGTFYGVEWRVAAKELRLEQRTVWDWREAKGFDGRHGRVKQT